MEIMLKCFPNSENYQVNKKYNDLNKCNRPYEIHGFIQSTSF